MRQTVYTITAAPMFPDGKTGFRRTIGEGFTLASALQDAAVWAEDFDPEEHSEPCESCGGQEPEDCDNAHCENGREEPNAFDVTASWSEIEGERLERWRRDRRLLIANRNTDDGAVGDKLAEDPGLPGIDLEPLQGYDIMQAVLAVVLNREETSPEEVNTYLASEGVETLYDAHIAPAITTVERAIRGEI